MLVRNWLWFRRRDTSIRMIVLEEQLHSGSASVLRQKDFGGCRQCYCVHVECGPPDRARSTDVGFTSICGNLSIEMEVAVDTDASPVELVTTPLCRDMDTSSVHFHSLTTHNIS